jgi:hypothetical protein
MADQPDTSFTVPKRPSADDPRIPSAEDRQALFAHLAKVVAEARESAQLIRRYLPVRGEAWAFGACKRSPGFFPAVINSLRRLDHLLYPTDLPFDATMRDWMQRMNPDADLKKLFRRNARLQKEEDPKAHRKRLAVWRQPYRGSDTAVGEVIPSHVCWEQQLFVAVHCIMANHDQILRHYGWGDHIARGVQQSWGWKWPKVPPIPEALLSALEKAADNLDWRIAEETGRSDSSLVGQPTKHNKQPGRPLRYPNALAMAIRMLDQGEEGDMKIYRACRDAHPGEKEKLPKDFRAFMRRVRHHRANPKSKLTEMT